MILLFLALFILGLGYGSHVRSQRRAAQRAREYRARRARCQRDQQATTEAPSTLGINIDPC